MANNVAHISVRGDRLHPSAFVNDLRLTASVEGVELTSKAVTVLRVDLDEAATTLLNDSIVKRTLTTTPALPDLHFGFQFFRDTMNDEGNIPSAKTQTFGSVLITPVGTPVVTTGEHGSAQFHVQAGYGGQGQVFGKLMVEQMDFYYPVFFYLNQPCICTACCTTEKGDVEDTGDDAIGLYAGERQLSTTDLSIPARGMDYHFTRNYRSQASHLRSAASNDFGVDWAISYIDDYLKPDGHNVILFSPSLRTDIFVATETSGEFIAPMELYEQLTLNADDNFTLRSKDGMVRTYRGFHDAYIPGRLIRMDDRHGNYMSFLYNRPKGLSKFVLTTVVDTMGRSIAYRYYSDSAHNPGRRGRLQEIEDFRRDNAYNGRTVRFDYDPEGNLITVVSPVVQKTSKGNDFLFGKTDVGQIVEGYQYDAYGRQTIFTPGANGVIDYGGDDVKTLASAVANPYLFTGRRLDEETKHYYYRARYFNVEQGRFISRDPIGYLTNLYEYVESNATNWLDPDGRIIRYGPNSMNCLGYATGEGCGIGPDPTGESLSSLLKKLGWSCKKVSASKKCTCRCDEKTIMVYIWSYDVNKVNGKLQDPWKDPWITAPQTKGKTNDYHAIKCDQKPIRGFKQRTCSKTTGWSYVPKMIGNWKIADKIVPKPGGGFEVLLKRTPKVNPKKVKGGDADNYWKGNVPKDSYCCCKPAFNYPLKKWYGGWI